MYGVRGEQYGIWNTARKCWQFDICEDTPMLAEARLFQKIGDDARKYRFEARPLPKEMRRTQPEPQLMIELQRKDRELKLLKHEHNAAIQDLEEACISLPSGVKCTFCKYFGKCSDALSDDCEEVSEWKWRGVRTHKEAGE